MVRSHCYFFDAVTVRGKQPAHVVYLLQHSILLFYYCTPHISGYCCRALVVELDNPNNHSISHYICGGIVLLLHSTHIRVYCTRCISSNAYPPSHRDARCVNSSVVLIVLCNSVVTMVSLNQVLSTDQYPYFPWRFFYYISQSELPHTLNNSPTNIRGILLLHSIHIRVRLETAHTESDRR
jgi:hypothetical protein